MNSTRWVTLTEFCKHLGRSGIARVDETEKGWFIAWIDSSPKALAKQESAIKKERATTSDEQRERLLIAEQIERAKAESEPSPETASPPEGLKREEGVEKVVLSFSTKPTTAAPSAPAFKMNPLKAKVNPLKRPNPLKQSSTPIAGTKRAVDSPSLEEQESKRRRTEQAIQ